MKKTTAMLMGATAAFAVQAQSSVTVYGLLDLSVGVSKTGSGTTLPNGTVATGPNQRVYRSDSGVASGSRLGFRGTENLGGGLRANFQLEMGIAADTGGLNQGGLAFGRQSWVGLGGSNWTVSLGRQYTPILNAVASTEALPGGYWGSISAEALQLYETIGSTPGNGTFLLGARADNSALATATAGPVTGSLMVAAGNENSRGTGRFINGSLVYSASPLRVTASYARLRQNAEQILPTADPEWMTLWQVGGTYDFGFVKLFAGAFEFKSAKNKANLSAVATLGAPGASSQAYSWNANRIVWLGASVPVGQGTFMAQVARETYPYTGAPGGKSTLFGVAYEYALSKRTHPYVSFGMVNNNAGARTPLYGAVTQVGPNGFGSDPRVLSVGLRHMF